MNSHFWGVGDTMRIFLLAFHLQFRLWEMGILRTLGILSGSLWHNRAARSKTQYCDWQSTPLPSFSWASEKADSEPENIAIVIHCNSPSRLGSFHSSLSCQRESSANDLGEERRWCCHRWAGGLRHGIVIQCQ
jgi:hypothetical protein